jgi:hypothetical protein
MKNEDKRDSITINPIIENSGIEAIEKQIKELEEIIIHEEHHVCKCCICRAIGKHEGIRFAIRGLVEKIDKGYYLIAALPNTIHVNTGDVWIPKENWLSLKERLLKLAGDEKA